MRPPAPMTPTRIVSLAPSTLVEASAVSPVAMRKLRRSMHWTIMIMLRSVILGTVLQSSNAIQNQRKRNGGSEWESNPPATGKPAARRF